eukprot:SM000041S15438  [mRNA]  locus=s41:171244:174577:+ [translate_table: standard]
MACAVRAGSPLPAGCGSGGPRRPSLRPCCGRAPLPSKRWPEATAEVSLASARAAGRRTRSSAACGRRASKLAVAAAARQQRRRAPPGPPGPSLPPAPLPTPPPLSLASSSLGEGAPQLGAGGGGSSPPPLSSPSAGRADVFRACAVNSAALAGAGELARQRRVAEARGRLSGVVPATAGMACAVRAGSPLPAGCGSGGPRRPSLRPCCGRAPLPSKRWPEATAEVSLASARAAGRRTRSSAACGRRASKLAVAAAARQQRRRAPPGPPGPSLPPAPLPTPPPLSLASSSLGEGAPQLGAGGGGSSPPPLSSPSAGRADVFRACAVNSAALAGAGELARQASHWAAASHLPVNDCTALMPCEADSSKPPWVAASNRLPRVQCSPWLTQRSSTIADNGEVWHVPAAAALALGVTGLRLVILKLSPAFAQASAISNQQVLSLLEPIDYVWLAGFSGFSEELLFRGALLPLVAPDWAGAAISGAVFGALHIGGGRNAEFALWASFIGFLYGAAGLATSDVTVPMVAHTLANLAAAVLWRLQSSSTKTPPML